ncbi:hypothetical protein NT03LS_1653 [Listeria seeligeri FSL N1-067]|uniref:Uncharacterized protein n=1 Tax=Listeria seeligeri FSL N1-067 TaxID=702453 RepID=E3ZQA9_LISSE|nr:hypothetical protein NT03LS_1653 [Listeria seeligeri FSL N1-067]
MAQTENFYKNIKTPVKTLDNTIAINIKITTTRTTFLLVIVEENSSHKAFLKYILLIIIKKFK